MSTQESRKAHHYAAGHSFTQAALPPARPTWTPLLRVFKRPQDSPKTQKAQKQKAPPGALSLKPRYAGAGVWQTFGAWNRCKES